MIITLCGSTKFKAYFDLWNAMLTMNGDVVISLGVFEQVDLPGFDWSTNGSQLKTDLDFLHFRKIDMAEMVFVIDPGEYIGESTRREIEYAQSKGKKIAYMSDLSSYIHEAAESVRIRTQEQPRSK